MIGYMFCEEAAFDAQQEEALLAFGCDEIVKDKLEGTAVSVENSHLEGLMKKSENLDKIVFYSLMHIEKSIIQIAEMLQLFMDNGVEIEVIERQANLTSKEYVKFIIDLASMEKEVIRRRTSRGLEEARRNGRIGGRPRISEEMVNSILNLHSSNKYTLRQIAERTGVSLGTAYKYIQMHSQFDEMQAERAKANI